MNHYETKPFGAHLRPGYNYLEGRSGYKIDMIVLHHTCTTYKSTFYTFDEEQSSAHIIIAQEGTRYRMVPDEDTAYTQGLQEPRRSIIHPNSRSLSIEMIHGYHGSGAYTQAQVESCAEQCAEWCYQYVIPLLSPPTGFAELASDEVLTDFRGIIGHSALTRNRSGDPGSFPWLQFTQLTQAYLSDRVRIAQV